jgi:hypothetical protein
LERAQTRRVGRAHVDDDVIREIAKRRERARVVLRGFGVGRVLVLADVDAERKTGIIG